MYARRRALAVCGVFVGRVCTLGPLEVQDSGVGRAGGPRATGQSSSALTAKSPQEEGSGALNPALGLRAIGRVQLSR